MTTKPEPRVIRAYALPVARFDHFKAYQRSLQLRADIAARESGRAEPAEAVTNSETLAAIVRQHEQLGTAAAFAGMRIDQFVTALYFGDLKTVPVPGGR
jgi:hypothetical protein